MESFWSPPPEILCTSLIIELEKTALEFNTFRNRECAFLSTLSTKPYLSPKRPIFFWDSLVRVLYIFHEKGKSFRLQVNLNATTFSRHVAARSLPGGADLEAVLSTARRALCLRDEGSRGLGWKCIGFRG